MGTNQHFAPSEAEETHGGFIVESLIRLVWILWRLNTELTTDRLYDRRLDLTMSWDRRLFAIGRIQPNLVPGTLPVKLTALLPQMSDQIAMLHVTFLGALLMNTTWPTKGHNNLCHPQVVDPLSTTLWILGAALHFAGTDWRATETQVACEKSDVTDLQLDL